PCAVLLPQDRGDGATIASGDLKDECGQAVEETNQTLPSYQRIRSWAVWPDLDFPRTPTGKPKLAPIAGRLPELLESGKREDDSDGFLTELGISIPAGGSLDSLTSLDRVELLSAVERRYNVELNETTFAEAKTVEDVRRLLDQPGSQRTDYVYPRWAQREL